MLQSLAGGQKGMSFFKPFFFLLVDSLLESVLLAAGLAFA